MITGRFRAPRGLDAAFCGACLLLVAALVPGAVLGGEVLSQSQLLYGFAPWQAHAPAHLPRVNAFLVDPPLVFYAFLVHAAEAVRQGHLPTWSAGLYAGHPFLASFQAAVCSPFTAIAYLLPLPFATVPLALAPLLVGAIGMRRFARTLGVGEAARWYAGLAWLLNGFAIVWFEHPLTAVACWLPWLLVAADRAASRPDVRSAASLAILVALAIVAGHPETVFKVLLFIGAWGAHRAWRGPRAGWLALAAGGTIGLLLAAVQVIPFAEYLRESEALARRTAASGNTFFLPIETLVTAIVPDFFGNPAHAAYLARVNRYGVAANYGEQQVYAGAVTILLAPIGLVAGWRDGRIRFFAAAAAGALAVMYGAPGIITLVSHLPILRVSILSRFGLVAITCAIALAARGVDALVMAPAPASSASGDGRGGGPSSLPGVGDGENRRWPAGWIAPGPRADTLPLWRALGASLGVLVVVIVAASVALAAPIAAAGLGGTSVRACAGAVAVLVAGAGLAAARLRGRLAPPAFGIAICALLACELSVVAHGFHETIAPRDVLPAVPEVEAVRRDMGLFRVYGWGTALLPNTAMAYGMQDARGWDGVQPARYTRLLDLGYLRQSADPSRHLADPILLDVLNVKYVFVPPGLTLPAPRFAPLDGTGGAVYVNRRVQPRAFLVDRYVALTDREIESALHGHRVDLTTTALLERDLTEPDRPADARGGVIGEAIVRRYEDTLVEVESEAPGRRLLVLADAYYPGWQASVDGRPATLLRADYALRAVPVGPGRHVVRFEYRPWTVRAGVIVSLSQAALLVIAVFSGRLRRTGATQPRDEDHPC